MQTLVVGEESGKRYAQRIYLMSDRLGQSLESKLRSKRSVKIPAKHTRRMVQWHLLSSSLTTFLVHEKKWSRYHSAPVRTSTVTQLISFCNITLISRQSRNTKKNTLFIIGLTELITNLLILKHHHQPQ
jgi:hypothetical protein